MFKSIEILGRRYKVNRKVLKEDHGLCHNDRYEIDLEKSLKGRELAQTFLHECIHGILHRSGATQGIEDGLEEVICETISNFLTDTWDFEL